MLNPSSEEPSVLEPSAGVESPGGSSREAFEASSEPFPPLPARLPPLFDLGRVLATPGALEALRDALTEPAELLHRHQRGDWADLSEADQAANRQALLSGDRLLSAYVLPESGEKVWIITEASRKVTTLLLPSEY